MKFGLEMKVFFSYTSGFCKERGFNVDRVIEDLNVLGGDDKEGERRGV